MIRIIFCLAFLQLGLIKVMAANCVAILNNGDWTNSASWSCGHQPTNGDNVSVPAGITIKVTSNINSTSDAIQIIVNGVLNFNTGKLNLGTGSGIVINTGGQIINTGGGGGSSVISIGGTNYWRASDGTISGYSTLGTPLDVSLINFVGNYKNNPASIFLEWQTIEENNNNHFEVMRSENGMDFSVIGIIKGNNNSKELISYTFVDANINSAKNYYYRIISVDNSDKTESTNTIRVSAVPMRAHISVFPNPIVDNNFEININFSQEEIVRILLYDTQIKLIYFKEFEFENSIQLNSKISFPVLNPGIYFLLIEGSSELLNSKIIVL